MFSKIFLFIFIITYPCFVSSQIVTIDPPDAQTHSHVTLTFDASEGNGELQGYQGDVYAYTGVITTESNGPQDWKHVRNNWGEVNPNTLMTPLGNDLYEISFQIDEFYEIDQNETVLQLALLFHNEDYSLVGRSENNQDIFVDINKKLPGNYISHQFTDQKLEIESENGNFEIRFFTPEMVKAEFIPEDVLLWDTTFTVIAKPQTIEPTLAENEDFLSFSSSELEVLITKSPVSLHYVVKGDTLLSESAGFSSKPAGGLIEFEGEEEENFYGGGSRAIPLNRKGQKLRIFNEAHYGYSNNTPTLNISIPFVVSDKLYGLFFDNRYPADLDLGSADQQKIIYNTQGGRLRYYFMTGNSFERILNQYTHLTGKQKLPPIWTLGYIQSKYGYENETEARNIVHKIQEEDFPLDALILDLYWFGTTNDMGNLDWDYSRFPDPETMISDFKEDDVQTILITEPYFTLNSVNYEYLAQNQLLATHSDGEPYVIWGFWAGDAALLDLTQKAAQDWMWNFYQERIEEGVGGWWCDLGEPETHPWDMQHQMGEAKSVHNIYSLIWAKFIDDNYALHYPQQRLFNLSRSGFAGMQRYSAFPWSGDIQRSFDGLRAQIPLMLGAGMSGLGYMHSDVGGFVGNDNDSELFTRWVQLGVFAPILRLHGIGTTEPVNFPDPFKSIMRKYIKLRYELLPYNYTLAYENTLWGTPMARQLNFYEPGNHSLADVNDAYLWGKDFLVAPVLDYSVSQRMVDFPEGKWLNFHDLSEYEGGNSYTVNCSIEDIPVFVRAGSFIPTAKSLKNTASYNSEELVIKYFPDQNVSFSEGYMFADDGTSTGTIENQQYEMISFEGHFENDDITIQLSKTGYTFENAPQNRNIIFEMMRITDSPETVMINDAEISAHYSADAFETSTTGWFWESSKQKLHVKLNWNGTSKTISVNGTAVNAVSTEDRVNPEFLLYEPIPNPFHQKFNVSLDIVTPGKYSFSLVDMKGIPVMQFEKEFWQKDNYSFGVEIPDFLTKGVFFLRVTNPNGISEIKRVIRY
ncbi:MAG: TIM-barrel domain-containing protein [Bacteroidota bacterium]